MSRQAPKPKAVGMEKLKALALTRSSPSDRLNLRLLQHGYSYNVLARAGFLMQRMPEAGNLYHHALE